MSQPSRAALVLLWLLLMPRSAAAVLPRFALLVGQRSGVSTGGSPLPELRHVEDSLARVREGLNRHAEFPGEHIRLLQNPDRRTFLATLGELKAALARLPARSEEALVLFYYYGHAENNTLLFGPEQVTKRELAELLRGLGAGLNLIVLDACNGGVPMGVSPKPQLDANPAELRELLPGRGVAWITSTSRDQLAFEPEGGALFTAAFVAGLRQAARDQVGISLEELFRDVSHRVKEEADLRRHPPQQPQIYYTGIIGTVYLTFPSKRNAYLVLPAELQGDFRVEYYGGGPIEVFHKSAGAPLKLAVYPGSIRLVGRIGDQYHRFPGESLIAGARMVVAAASARVPVGHAGLAMGRAAVEPVADPEGFPSLTSANGPPLELTILRQVPSLELTAAGELGTVPTGLLGGGPAGQGQVALRYGPWLGVVGGRLGQAQASYPTWSYEVRSWGADLGLGYSVVLEPFYLALLVTSGLEQLRQEYRSGQERQSWLVRTGLEANLGWPIGERLLLELYANLGPAWAPVEQDAALHRWTARAAGGMRLRVRLDDPARQPGSR